MSSILNATMDFLRSRKRIICIMAPVLFGVLYMVLCMAQLTQSIWFDESYSAYLTRYDYAQIWSYTAQDVHPPLYYFALKTWAHFFGHTDFAMRMLSVVCGAVAILFAFLWLKYKYGASAAILATALLSISPVFVRYGQEMRMYTMVLAIVFAATYVLQLAIDNRKKRWWIIYAVLLALGMWTHYFCAFAWLAHVVYLFGIYHKKFFTRRIILTYALAVTLFLPWIPSFIAQTGAVQQGFWIPAISAKSIADYWSESLMYQYSDDIVSWLFLLYAAATITIFALAVKFRARLRMLLSLAIVPLILIILVSLPPLSSMFIPRYVMYSITAISLVAGVATILFARSPIKNRSKKIVRRRAIVIVASTAVLISTSICGLVSVFTLGNYNFSTTIKPASKELFETIVALDNNENLAIISDSEWLYYDLAFYSTNEHSAYFMNEKVSYEYGSQAALKGPTAGRIENLDKFIAKRDSFWYITTINEDTGKLATKFPRKGWRVEEYSTSRFNNHSDTYAIVKMVKK